MPAFTCIAIFSVAINLLTLTGPVFMMQVYDRVIPSRSAPTLVVLFSLVIVLFATLALLEALRSRIGIRIGAGIRDDLDPVVLQTATAKSRSATREASSSLSDLDALRKFAASPVAFALVDLPFTPAFLAIIYTLHPLLGALAFASGAALVAIATLNQLMVRKPSLVAMRANATASRLGEAMRAQIDTLRSLGMMSSAILRWQGERSRALAGEVAVSDLTSGLGSVSKSLRQLIQSAMLALGAWLVVKGEMSAGVMIASSIMLGRALAPVELLVNGWEVAARARMSWASLSKLLSEWENMPKQLALPRPAPRLTVRDLSVVPPGSRAPSLSRISFTVEPGQAVAVVGETGSGKSTLARALVGLWRPTNGDIRIDGAKLEHFGDQGLADILGYLPQEIQLFDGTVAENIARLKQTPVADDIMASASLAGAHKMILGLPDGYNTVVGQYGTALSGGQKQLIGLARALYGDPVMVVLDEPNSNLDLTGCNAVNDAIRTLKKRGRIAVVVAHRPVAIAECDRILMLSNREAVAFGPKEEILRKIAANHSQLSAVGQSR